jgi:hypothetical protein
MLHIRKTNLFILAGFIQIKILSITKKDAIKQTDLSLELGIYGKSN